MCFAIISFALAILLMCKSYHFVKWRKKVKVCIDCRNKFKINHYLYYLGILGLNSPPFRRNKVKVNHCAISYILKLKFSLQVALVALHCQDHQPLLLTFSPTNFHSIFTLFRKC